MKHLKILVFALVAMLASCGSEEGGGNNMPTEKTTVDGIVEKGPFVQGSKVTLYDLDGDMTQTGLQFVTTTSNDLGKFTFNSPINSADTMPNWRRAATSTTNATARSHARR